MKKLIIIGAGISGLSAGIYGKLNGFNPKIYEMRSLPGGECTAWKRGLYTIDGCINYLAGTKENTPLNHVWQEVGALSPDTKIFNHDEFIKIEAARGRFLTIFRNVDKLEDHLISFSYEDKDFILSMCRSIKKLSKFELQYAKPSDLSGMTYKIKTSVSSLKYITDLSKLSKISLKDYLSPIKSKYLKQALLKIMPANYSAINLIAILGSLNAGDSGYPKGGSLTLAKNMEKRYKELGGKIFYNKKVVKITIDDNKATGILLADGTKVHGDLIISCTDGYETVFNMLEGKYLNDQLKNLYSDKLYNNLQSSLLVSLGINFDLSTKPHNCLYLLDTPFEIGNITYDSLQLRHYCYDKILTPKNKSVVTTQIYTDYEYWQKLNSNETKYILEKSRIGNIVKELVEIKFPNTKGKIEEIDVATPITYERYCHAWRGSWLSWQQTPTQKIPYFSGSLPNLKNFYMASQWTNPPGGLSGAVLAGKWLIDRLAKINVNLNKLKKPVSVK